MRDSNADWRRAKLRDLVSINPESLSSDTPHTMEFADLTSVERRIKWPSDTIRFGSAPRARGGRQGDILMSAVGPYLKGHFCRC